MSYQAFDNLNQSAIDLYGEVLRRGIDPRGIFPEAPTPRDTSPLAWLRQKMGFEQKPDSNALLTQILGAQELLKADDNRRSEEAELEAERLTKKQDKRNAELYKLAGFDPEKVQKIYEINRESRIADLPLNILERRLAGQEALRQTQEQLAATMPYLDEAGRRATGRALAASERFLTTKEQMPSAIQNIMASKQNQMLSAQAGEADLMRAVAAQQQAAKQFAGSYAGKFVSAG
jgi:hypothetical protein